MDINTKSRIDNKIKNDAKRINKFMHVDNIIKEVSGSGYIREYVNEILPLLKEDIRNELDSNSGKNYSVSELPTIFDVPGMTNKRAQLYVYFHLIKSLELAGYSPKIRISNNGNDQKVYIYISWFTKNDIITENQMNNYIKNHVISNIIEKSDKNIDKNIDKNHDKNKDLTKHSIKKKDKKLKKI